MPCSFSRLRRQSWRLAPSIGSFEIKIAASNAIGLRKNVSWRDHRPLRVNRVDFSRCGVCPLSPVSDETADLPACRQVPLPDSCAAANDAPNTMQNLIFGTDRL